MASVIYIVHPQGANFFKFGITQDIGRRVGAYQTAYGRFDLYHQTVPDARACEQALAEELELRGALRQHMDSDRYSECAELGSDMEHLAFARDFVKRYLETGNGISEDVAVIADPTSEREALLSTAETFPAKVHIARLATCLFKGRILYSRKDRLWCRVLDDGGLEPFANIREVLSFVGREVCLAASERYGCTSRLARAVDKECVVDSVLIHMASMMGKEVAVEAINNAVRSYGTHCAEEREDLLAAFLGMSTEERGKIRLKNGCERYVEIRNVDQCRFVTQKEFKDVFTAWDRSARLEYSFTDKSTFHSFNFNCVPKKMAVCMICKGLSKKEFCGEYFNDHRSSTLLILGMEIAFL